MQGTPDLSVLLAFAPPNIRSLIVCSSPFSHALRNGPWYVVGGDIVDCIREELFDKLKNDLCKAERKKWECKNFDDLRIKKVKSCKG